MTPVGFPRYYIGIMQLVSLLIAGRSVPGFLASYWGGLMIGPPSMVMSSM